MRISKRVLGSYHPASPCMVHGNPPLAKTPTPEDPPRPLMGRNSSQRGFGGALAWSRPQPLQSEFTKLTRASGSSFLPGDSYVLPFWL